jgi:NAD(P)-dependent dehydrogenase (short-subunit alcohol dehydrogenase family)
MGAPIELDEASWHRTIDLNVTSCFITCKHVLPHMLERRAGAIINVSSIAGIHYTGYPYVATMPLRRLLTVLLWGSRCNMQRTAFASMQSCPA